MSGKLLGARVERLEGRRGGGRRIERAVDAATGIEHVTTVQVTQDGREAAVCFPAPTPEQWQRQAREYFKPGGRFDVGTAVALAAVEIPEDPEGH